MKLVLISPERDVPLERETLAALFDAGLERYHVRKPTWTRSDYERWLSAWPQEARSRMVLHDQHDLVTTLALGGRHWRDDVTAPTHPPKGYGLTSRSCHQLRGLEAALGRYEAVFFSPVFPSLSKPGYGPVSSIVASLRPLLSERTPAQRSTEVLALGGVTTKRLIQCRELGFDGVAVLGAVWQAENPLRAFEELHSALLLHAA